MASVCPLSVLRISCITFCLLLLSLLSFNVGTTAADDIRWIKYTGNNGVVWLDDNRRPSLYTQNFGDCQGDSLINVTRFDAAYYKDNMTVLFHLEGNSALADEDLMCELYFPDTVLTSTNPQSRTSVYRCFCLW